MYNVAIGAKLPYEPVRPSSTHKVTGETVFLYLPKTQQYNFIHFSLFVNYFALVDSLPLYSKVGFKVIEISNYVIVHIYMIYFLNVIVFWILLYCRFVIQKIFRFGYGMTYPLI